MITLQQKYHNITTRMLWNRIKTIITFTYKCKLSNSILSMNSKRIGKAKESRQDITSLFFDILQKVKLFCMLTVVLF